MQGSPETVTCTRNDGNTKSSLGFIGGETDLSKEGSRREHTLYRTGHEHQIKCIEEEFNLAKF